MFVLCLLVACIVFVINSGRGDRREYYVVQTHINRLVNDSCNDSVSVVV